MNLADLSTYLFALAIVCFVIGRVLAWRRRTPQKSEDQR